MPYGLGPKVHLHQEQKAKTEHKKLHWEFNEAGYQKSPADFSQVFARQVAADLTLVGSKIGHSQKEAPGKARPNRVSA